jgi:predicted ATPase
VKELCRSTHADGAAVLWGSCDEELGGAYQPFAEALGWLADATAQGQLAELLGPAGTELLPIVPQLQQLVPGLGTRLLDDAESERNRLFEAATRLLSNLSERQPVVRVLDDLHWARKPTLLLLRHLLKTTSPLRLLVLATYRDTDLDRTHPLAEMLADLRRQNGVERLALHGLDEHGVRLFLQRAAGHDLDEQGMRLVATVHPETEGNPFFIGEVLRHLSESGALVFRDSRWTSDRQLGEVGIPEGIREVIGRRLSHLDSAANEVLTRAAVIGREFDLRLLAELSEGTTDDVLDTLAAAERSGLVEAVTGRPGCYRFSHALVRSTLYDELPASRRLRLHQAIGTAIEGRGDPERHLTELARHFTEAAALGSVAKAADYCRRAGDQARADLAFEEAAVQYQRGLDVLDLADANDPELEVRRRPARRRRGRPEPHRRPAGDRLPAGRRAPWPKPRRPHAVGLGGPRPQQRRLQS